MTEERNSKTLFLYSIFHLSYIEKVTGKEESLRRENTWYRNLSLYVNIFVTNPLKIMYLYQFIEDYKR